MTLSWAFHACATACRGVSSVEARDVKKLMMKDPFTHALCGKMDRKNTREGKMERKDDE